MSAMRGGNGQVYAVSVHERLECAIDLVRNLRHLDPGSTILLYDGSGSGDLLPGGFPFDREGVVVHPRPRPVAWGSMHGFALDCFRYALAELSFDAMTFVDSDQLGTRPGYSRAIREFLEGRPEVGVIASAAGPHGRDSKIEPVATAWEEFELWLPFLRRFPDGEAKFVQWSFWPGTTFTRRAAECLVRLMDGDEQFREIMARSKIWATEEILLPTLAALLGYEVAASPFRQDFVKYRVPYAIKQMDVAMDDPEVFWVHPVPREYGCYLRQRIRDRHDHYAGGRLVFGAAEGVGGSSGPPAYPAGEVREAIAGIEGWLEPEEADILMDAAARALAEGGGRKSIVEVGSYQGRSTVALGSVARALRPGEAKVYAIDPHGGLVGALGQDLAPTEPTLDRFRANIAAHGLDGVVEAIVARSTEVAWDRPIDLLFIDGLHDYVNVALDFFHFERWLVEGARVAFHDDAPYYPGVSAFINERIASGRYIQEAGAGSMTVIRKVAVA